MAVGTTTSNLFQALKATIAPGAKTGIRELITTMMPGAQSFVDPMVTFFEKLKELHLAAKSPTDENTLDTREFSQEVALLRKSFAVSLNPFHYVWTFVKFILGLGSSTDAKVNELKRFGGLANMPYGPTTYAVEACESLIKIIKDQRNSKQNFISRILFPNKLANDPVILAAEDALKSWLPKIANMDQRKKFFSILNYEMPNFIAKVLGPFMGQQVATGEAEIEAAKARRNQPAGRQASGRSNVPAGIHAPTH